jgi:hypothetical protein
MLGRYSPDPSLTQSYSFGFGYPSRHSVGSVIGMGDRGAPGVVVRAAVAWMPVRGRDYSLGLEIADLVALSGSGARNMFAVAIAVQLDLFRYMPNP